MSALAAAVTVALIIFGGCGVITDRIDDRRRREAEARRRIRAEVCRYEHAGWHRALVDATHPDRRS